VARINTAKSVEPSAGAFAHDSAVGASHFARALSLLLHSGSPRLRAPRSTEAGNEAGA